MPARSRLSVALGFGLLSAPDGERTPFAGEGAGVTGQGWFEVVPWAAVGVQVGLHAASFDEEACCDSIGCGYSGDLTYSSPRMMDVALVARLVPLPWSRLRPFLDLGVGNVTWQEEYRYEDIEWGPWFPSGTIQGVDQSRSGEAWLLGAGVCIDAGERLGLFLEAQRLFVSGTEIEGRWSRLRFGLTWRLRGPGVG